MTENAAILNRSKVVVVSDVHLCACDDTRGKLFLRFLAELPSNLESLVLLGDIFDFCISGRYFAAKFAPVGLALSNIAKSGTRVIFVQGNHEFELDRLCWPGVEVMTARDNVLQLKDGTKIALTHGDLVASSWHYHLFFRFVHSWLVLRLATSIPGALLDRLCLRLSSQSRRAGERYRIPHRRILIGGANWLKNLGCKFGIMGHFHVPYYYKVPQHPAHLLCLNSWDKPNALLFDGKEFTRLYF